MMNLLLIVPVLLVSTGVHAQDAGLPVFASQEPKDVSSLPEAGVYAQGAWETVFASRELEVVQADFSWTEGPVWVPERKTLYFSSPTANTLFQFKPELDASATPLVENSGGAPEEELAWRAEPGSNGLARRSNGDLLVCQHGAHSVSSLDLATLTFTPLVSEHNGKPFNSPNDLAVHGDVVYFTDPAYGLQEKSRFFDGNHLEERSAELGQGFSGIFRVDLTDENPQAVLLDNSLSRPNGIQVTPDGRDLLVSESCQGTFNPGCTQGTTRYLILDLDEAGLAVESRYSFDVVHPKGTEAAGTSDGFKVHPPTGWIVGSCAGPAVCIVDWQTGTLLGRLDVDFKVSNVEFAFEVGYMFVTGENHLWRIPLAAPSAAVGEL